MKALVISAIVATTVMGASLIDEAKSAGLKPIPTSAKALEKLTSNPKNPTTAAKVELGKCSILNRASPKAG
jgi:cytochrome c peroxidase